MFNKKKTDVLVVGAGPVGLFTALVLVHKGIKTQVVEEQWRGASRSYALGLHPQSLRLFRELGFADRVVEQGNRIETIGLYDHTGKRRELSLSELTGFPYVLVLPQQALEEVLRTELEKRGCKVDWSHRLAGLEEEGDVVRASVERLSKESTGYSVARTEWVVDKTLQIEASFVVGADGHRSVVRRLADIEFEDLGSSNVFAVFEFDTDSDAGSELQLVLDEGTTSVLWPMANGRFRWSFEIANAQEQTDARIKSRLLVQLRDEPYPYVTEDELTRLIRDRAPWFTPQTREVVWSAAIRFEKRLASTFGRDRVWLAGDAAHLALPIGIQSMNIGLREAKKLGRNLADILSRRGGCELLETYNRGRLTEWTRLLSRQTAPIPQLEADEWITQRATRISQCLPASGRDLTTLLEKLGLQLSAD